MDAIRTIQLLLLWLSATFVSLACAGVDVSSDQPRYRDVALGETIVISYLLEASTDAPYVRLDIGRGFYFDPNWQIRSLEDPGCGSLSNVDFFGSASMVLAPFAARSARTCRLTVTRGATAYSALSLGVTPRGSGSVPPFPPPLGRSAIVGLGESTDIAVRVETNTFFIDPQGLAHSDVRLVVTNNGPTGIRPITVGGCLDNIFPSFSIDSNGPDGCGSLNHSPLCFDYGYGIRTPSIPGNSEFSCRMRLNGRTPFRAPEFVFIGIERSSLWNLTDTGGFVIDRDPENDLTVIPFGPANAPAIPSLGPFAMLILFAALILASAIRR